MRTIPLVRMVLLLLLLLLLVRITAAAAANNDNKRILTTANTQSRPLDANYHTSSLSVHSCKIFGDGGGGGGGGDGERMYKVLDGGEFVAVC